MALSTAAVRAIAIRKRIQMTASSPVVANDNQPKRARRPRATLNDACVAAAGFADHAAY